jgi:hypothetical protein
MRAKVRGCVAVLLVVIVALAATAASASAKACGRVYVADSGLKAKARVVRGGGSCSGAKHLIRDAYTREDEGHWNRMGAYGVFWRVDGWRCSIGLGATETFCRRSGREIDGSFRHGDGWSF